MMPDNYTKGEMFIDLKEINEHIKDENLQGAPITHLIEDVQEHYEVASRFNFKNSKGHYSDLLSLLLRLMGTKITADILNENHVNNEQKLWRHVILNAFEDCRIGALEIGRVL